jgi:hypothetical protein
MLHLGELHVKHAAQLEIWVPTQYLLWDQEKPRKTLIELAGRRTFQMQTDFQSAVRNGRNEALTLVLICVAASLKNI